MPLVSRYLAYIRRSYKRADAADVSDETQEAVCRSLVPPGATVEVIRDSGGHQSGATDDRDGYQELIRRVAAGGIDGIVVYDLSRLARNVRLMTNLLHELERRQVAILAGNLPTTRMDSAVGRFMFHMVTSAAQFQRDLDSERMRAMTRQAFEAGGHRGLDPFGYRTVPDIKPRALQVVETEAAVVRRIWRDLPTMSTEAIAQRLNIEGVPHRETRPWTRNAVKDIVRRGRFYLGMVTSGRGIEERPGRHPAILDEATWRAGFEASRARHRGAIRTGSRRRVYVLAGLLSCGACGGRMHGQASQSRGREWRYYLCRHCPAPSVPADALEQAFRERVAAMVLPQRAIEVQRESLRSDRPRDVGRERRRLEAARARLTEMYQWGDVGADDYRTRRLELERAIALLPTDDGLVLFDRNRAALVSMAEAIGEASIERVREAALLLVETAHADGRDLGDVLWTPPAAPFFAVGMAPPDGLEPPQGRIDVLAYYRRVA